MQQIADWLEKLGMSEYAQRFAENRIDFSVLPGLTDQDLKDLGVALGDRRKILRAIAGLKSTEAVASSPATEAVIARPQDAAERRQVTVMFSDLVGSTACRHVWTLKTSARSFRPIRSAWQIPCVALVGSWPSSTWAMVSSSISDTRRHMKTTPSGPCALGWS